MVENQQNSLLGKIAAYTEILASDPRSTIFVSLSESYRKMGMLDDAFAVAVKGLEFLPDYGPGHVVLARIQCQQDDLAGSEKSFQKALQLDDANLAALVGCARLYLLQDLSAEARKLLLRARDLSPADSVINKLLLSIPEEEEPVEPQPSPESTDPEPAALQPSPALTDDEPVAGPASVPTEPPTSEPFQSVTLADLYLKQGFVAQSLEVFKSLLARDPDNLELRRRIRDVESMISATAASPTEPGCAPVIPENSDNAIADKSPLDTGDMVEKEGPGDIVDIGGVAAAEVPGIPVEESTILAQLNSLLTSIQRRRGDV